MPIAILHILITSCLFLALTKKQPRWQNVAVSTPDTSGSLSAKRPAHALGKGILLPKRSFLFKATHWAAQSPEGCLKITKLIFLASSVMVSLISMQGICHLKVCDGISKIPFWKNSGLFHLSSNTALE